MNVAVTGAETELAVDEWGGALILKAARVVAGEADGATVVCAGATSLGRALIVIDRLNTKAGAVGAVDTAEGPAGLPPKAAAAATTLTGRVELVYDAPLVEPVSVPLVEAGGWVWALVLVVVTAGVATSR